MPPGSQGLWTVAPKVRDMTLAEVLAAGMVCRSWHCGLASPTGEAAGAWMGMPQASEAPHG